MYNRCWPGDLDGDPGLDGVDLALSLMMGALEEILDKQPALSAVVGCAHPTFAQYFLLIVPFLAILSPACTRSVPVCSSRTSGYGRCCWSRYCSCSDYAERSTMAVTTTTGASTNTWRRRSTR